MSGETESNVSAWTPDSLHAHLLRILTEKDLRDTQRYEAQDRALEGVTKHFEAILVEREKATLSALTGLRDFYNTVLKERDERYEQRFANGEKAVVVALATVDKEFAERVRQVRDETLLAMAAAEKAIVKAEMATEKRFESVNEFRAQQADIITTFARKSEVDTRLLGLTEKVDGFHAQSSVFAATSMPRAEYDRAHTDLAERVVQVEKGLVEKLEAQTKAFDGRMALLQSQLASIEAVTR